jgi:hypothetical protein
MHEKKWVHMERNLTEHMSGVAEIPRHGREARAMAVVIFFFSGCTIAKGRSSSSE